MTGGGGDTGKPSPKFPLISEFKIFRKSKLLIYLPESKILRPLNSGNSDGHPILIGTEAYLSPSQIVKIFV